jgi:hypothetical protein
MHWKDTVLKSSQIKWTNCKPKSIDDGKLDFDLHIPLTSIFEGQARISFAQGLTTMFEFMNDLIQTKKQINLQDFVKFYEDCGYPDFAKDIKTLKTKPDNTGKGK